jgi:hypothetical protein
MTGLKGDEAASQKTIDRIAAKHGKETIMDWLKRFEGLSPENAKPAISSSRGPGPVRTGGYPGGRGPRLRSPGASAITPPSRRPAIRAAVAAAKCSISTLISSN